MTERDDWQTVRDELTPELRRQIVMEYKGKCVICGTAKTPHIDHIVPVSLGGRSVSDNLWILCAEHNRQKGAQWPTYWLKAMLDERDEIVDHNSYSFRNPKSKDRDPIMNFNGWTYQGDGDRPFYVVMIDYAISSATKYPHCLPDHALTSSLDHRFWGYEEATAPSREAESSSTEEE